MGGDVGRIYQSHSIQKSMSESIFETKNCDILPSVKANYLVLIQKYLNQ